MLLVVMIMGLNFPVQFNRSDTHEFAARGLDPSSNIAVCLDNITTKDSLSHLDPKCPVLVQNLITNHEYKYIVNDIRYAPKLLH